MAFCVFHLLLVEVQTNSADAAYISPAQLGAVAGVLGTVGQFIIDRSIMEEVKTYRTKSGISLL